MLPLTSKTCTKLSKIFLACSILPLVLLVMAFYGNGMFNQLFVGIKNIAYIYYPGCLLSGLSLFFSTRSYSKTLKRSATFIHFSYVYCIVLVFIGFVGIKRYDFFIVLIAYLLLSIRLLKKNTKNQKKIEIVCLGIPMLFSTGFFLKINYDLLTSGTSWELIGYVILLSLSGLIGLILSVNINNENRKVKWILLGLNYIFAMYFHIVILIIGL